VYICEVDSDIETCVSRNIHNRTEKEVGEQKELLPVSFLVAFLLSHPLPVQNFAQG
jgi:hypothetical protein